jgi:uncharacterized membrane protein YgcG
MFLTRSVLVGAALTGLVATGCGETMYAYVPTTNAGAPVAGQPAADYPLPPTAPRGDVKIASYGITDVHPKDNPNLTLGAVHLHAEVANGSDRVWTLDTREQMLELGGHGAGAPAFALADSAGDQPPLVAIQPGQHREIDLFYILPKDLQDSDEVPAFACAWRVNTGEAIVADRTSFQRVEIDPGNYPAGYVTSTEAAFYDGPYWVNPYYPYGGFYGAVIIPGGGYWGHGIYVHRGPTVGGFHGGWHGGGGGGWHGGGGHGGGHGGGGHGGGHR